MFKYVNPKLFHPARIELVSQLYMARKATLLWRQLKEKTDMPDGNLHSHLRALIKEQLITKKVFIKNNRAYTKYTLNDLGHSHFNEMLEQFKALYDYCTS